MDVMAISRLVGSSAHQAIADDALKDEDNAAWIMALPPNIRQAWIERVTWIRLVDRLAEKDLLDPKQTEFASFYQGWQSLYRERITEAGHPYRKILGRMQQCWFRKPEKLTDRLSILAWDKYVKAIATYHQPNLIIKSLDQYEAMLEQLSGSFFQIFPFLEANQYDAVRAFGILDQFYNNLRDIEEDANQGICYFPTDLLDQFGLSRQDILSHQGFLHPGYSKMMQFWLNDFQLKLRKNARPFITLKNLHPSWQHLRQWSLRRYNRINHISHRCHFNPILFSKHYWQEVKLELASSSKFIPLNRVQ